jgi:YgiT-type zinc finger domain-containing protein
MTTKIIDCPRCAGKTKIETASVPIKYNGKDYLVDQSFYKCDRCAMEFTTEELDWDAWNQVMTKAGNERQLDMWTKVITDIQRMEVVDAINQCNSQYIISMKGESITSLPSCP